MYKYCHWNGEKGIINLLQLAGEIDSPKNSHLSKEAEASRLWPPSDFPESLLLVVSTM